MLTLYFKKCILFFCVGQMLCYLLLPPTSHFPVRAMLFPVITSAMIRSPGMRVSERIRIFPSLTFWNILSGMEMRCSVVFFSQSSLSVGKRNSLKRLFFIPEKADRVRLLPGASWVSATPLLSPWQLKL